MSRAWPSRNKSALSSSATACFRRSAFRLAWAAGSLPADQIPHGAKTVMLSYGYWQRRFGGDRSAIGRNITVDSRPREIVGVMPRGFRFVNADFDLIVPLAFDRSKLILAGFGYPGHRPAQARSHDRAGQCRPGPPGAGLDGFLVEWARHQSAIYETWRITPALRPLKQEVVGNVGNVLWVVMGTIGLVMLIACANVANLLLVRAEARQQELAIRAALGAGWGRIVAGAAARERAAGTHGRRARSRARL